MPQALAPKLISKSFSTVLTRTTDKLRWTIIRLPFDSAKLWGTRKALRVKGEMNGFPFRATLFPSGNGRHMMVVNKQMQKGGRASAGMAAKFRLEPDLEERVIAVPPELERILKRSKSLRKFYDSFSPYMRRYVSDPVSQARHAETRARRAEQVAERLMETMEAEIELPPLIRQAFARNPQAAARWNRLSPSHRRGYLLAIFYYRNFDARLRRIEKMMSELIRSSADRPDEQAWD
jgi:uncharacterized protein YdeI (YjbR/CyaY-like superfamily)